MTQLAKWHLEDMARLNALCVDAAKVETLQHAVLELMERTLRADSCCFIINNGSSWNPDYSRNVGRGLSDDFWRGYRSFTGQKNPYDRWLMTHAQNPRFRVAPMEQIIAPQRLFRTDFYNTVMRPRAVHHTLGMTLIARKRPIAGMAFTRAKNHASFDDADILFCRLVSDVIASALDTCLLLEKIQMEKCVRTAVAQEDKEPVLAVNERLRVMYSNEAAHALFPELQDNALPRSLEEMCERFLCGQSSGAGVQETQSVTLPLSGQSLKGTLQLVQDDATKHRLVVVRFDTAKAAVCQRSRMRAYGMSNREEHVATALADGLTNVEIADRIGISVRTVENHLRSIYRKVGVNSRTKLIYQLSRMH